VNSQGIAANNISFVLMQATPGLSISSLHWQQFTGKARFKKNKFGGHDYEY
jgi:hypothetical protein